MVGLGLGVGLNYMWLGEVNKFEQVEGSHVVGKWRGFKQTSFNKSILQGKASLEEKSFNRSMFPSLLT